MATDYYETLGVSRGASQDEIEKAYTKLAHKHHPDKAGGDEAKMKQVNEAYAVLGNVEKRKQYDQFGQTFSGNGGSPFGQSGFQGSPFGGFRTGGVRFEDFGDVSDIFGDLFGMGSRRGGTRTARGSDIEMQMHIPFRDAATGGERDVAFSTNVACSRCTGSGAEPGAKLTSCPQCKGTGRVEQMQQTILGSFRTQAQCPTCDGRGQRPEKRCEKCRGSGAVRDTVRLTLQIPPGIRSGQTLRLTAKGEAGERGTPAGDLYVTVTVDDDPVLARDEDDVTSTVALPYTTAVLGGEVSVETLSGPVALHIPANTPSGKVLRLKAKGFPHLNGRGHGDHLVTVVVDVPKRVSKRAKDLLKDLDEELRVES